MSAPKMYELVEKLRKKSVLRKDGARIVLRRVTPEFVDMLELYNHTDGVNRNNRQIVSSRVQELAALIEEGQWKAQLSPITYIRDRDNPDHPRDGALSSGQHRLLAIKRAGIPVYVEFKELDSSEAMFDDVGRGRTTLQNIGINFSVNPECLNILGKYYSLLLYLREERVVSHGSYSYSQRLSLDQLLVAVEKTREHIAWFSKYKAAPEHTFKYYMAFLVMLRYLKISQSDISGFHALLTQPTEHLPEEYRDALEKHFVTARANSHLHAIKRLIILWNIYKTGIADDKQPAGIDADAADVF